MTDPERVALIRCATRSGLVVSLIAVALGLSASSASANAWTQPKRTLWWKVGLVYQYSTEIYAASSAVLPDGTPIEPGDTRPFDNDGAARQRLIWNEIEYGITNGLTFGFQFPFYDLRFENNVELTDSWGFGDLRFVLRQALLMKRMRLSVRGAVKLPSGKAATNPNDVPVSEGQTDLELGLQWGYSLNRALSWLGAEFQRRWRYEDDEGRTPGDEWFWRINAGYAPWQKIGFGIKVEYAGLRSDPTFINGFQVPGQRSFDIIYVGALIVLGQWLVEPSWLTTVAGQAFPAGESWNLGISRHFSL